MLETLATAAILSLSMTVLHKMMLAWMSNELEKPGQPLDVSTPVMPAPSLIKHSK